VKIIPNPYLNITNSWSCLVPSLFILSSISLSLAAVFTGLAAPKIDDAATGAPTSSTGSVRGFNCSFGRSVTTCADGAAGSGSRGGGA